MRAAFLFDLDGTLIDSVYQHVLAWREALEQGGIRLSVWRIHRRIGMSGGLFVNALLRETGRNITGEEAERQPRAESPERPAGGPDGHARPSAACEARSGSVPGRGRAAGGVHSRLDRGRRQHLGPAGRAARPSARCRTAFRRLWPGGVGEGRSLSRLSRPSRPADALGRTRHPPGGLIMRDAASGGTSSLSPGYRNPAYRTIGGDGCGWYPGTAIRIRRRRIAPAWTARRR